MFRNAGGACDSLPYLLREYWQDIIIVLIGFQILKKIIQITKDENTLYISTS